MTSFLVPVACMRVTGVGLTAGAVGAVAVMVSGILG